MKLKYFVFAAVAAAFLSSYIPTDGKVKEGNEAPAIETVNGGKIEMKDGKEKIISFWSPKNPSSRISNKELSKKCNFENIEFISICIDSDESLAKEVLKYDGLMQNGSHLQFTDVENRVFKDYGVEEHPASFRIDGNGKIAKI